MVDDIIDTLGLDPADYDQWRSKGEKFLLHQVRRKIRYLCFAIQRGETVDISSKFFWHYESQPHFCGWALFADRWDVTKPDPLMTYPRKFSINEEWDATLRMAVPELEGAIAYRQTQ